jgi:hypothetical protein
VLEAVLSSDAEAALALQHYENILSGTLVSPDCMVRNSLHMLVIAAAGCGITKTGRAPCCRLAQVLPRS